MEERDSYFKIDSSFRVAWLPEENLSLYYHDGTTKEDVTCCKCKKQVVARECTCFIGAATYDWICKECHSGDDE